MTGICSMLKMVNGEVLFREGQIADRFYLVEKGAVFILDQAGENAIRIYEADQLFGLPEVLAGAIWTHTAIAAGRTHIKTFPGELLFQRLEQMPLAHRDFINDMARLGI